MALDLSSRNSMSSADHLSAIYSYLSSTLLFDVPGAIVEVGCNAGYTSVWLQQIICDISPGRELHLFDSFQGMPPAASVDPMLKEGDLPATVADVLAKFDAWSLPYPTIHEGWFEDTLPEKCPKEICFAYVDGDFRESIAVTLKHVYPKLAPGAAVLIDDYGDTAENPLAWAGLPGVKIACDEFFSDKDEKPEVLFGLGGMAVALLRKPIAPR